MLRGSLILPAALALSACFQTDGPQEQPLFVGTWTCETATLTLTAGSYDDGTGPKPLTLITQENGSFTLFLQDGRRIGLGLVTEAGLTWVREGSRDGQTCRRLL